MRNLIISLLCVTFTLLVYALNKRLYRRWRTLLLMPLVMTPVVLVLTHISWQDYICRKSLVTVAAGTGDAGVCSTGV